LPCAAPNSAIHTIRSNPNKKPNRTDEFFAIHASIHQCLNALVSQDRGAKAATQAAARCA
jgi:hypothetical protein